MEGFDETNYDKRGVTTSGDMSHFFNNLWKKANVNVDANDKTVTRPFKLLIYLGFKRLKYRSHQELDQVRIIWGPCVWVLQAALGKEVYGRGCENGK